MSTEPTQLQAQDERTHAKKIADIDLSIAKLKELNKETMAPYEAEKKRLDGEAALNGLLTKRIEIQRQIDALPFKTRIEELKLAEADELRPWLDKEHAAQATLDHLNEQRRVLQLTEADAKAVAKQQQIVNPTVPKGATVPSAFAGPVLGPPAPPDTTVTE